MQFESYDISDQGKSCCSTGSDTEEFSYENHWNSVYASKPADQLGWYETDFTPEFRMIRKTGLGKDARVLNVGAGNTLLVDELLKQGFCNIIASDISKTALEQLQNRVGASAGVECIVDDLTEPAVLPDIPEVDLWVDRAVLHFFTLEEEQETYSDLLNRKVKKGGYALLAQFHKEGARTCSGLPVKRYDEDSLCEKMGSDFKLLDSFKHIYTMPSGEPRPYIYALFEKV